MDPDARPTPPWLRHLVGGASRPTHADSGTRASRRTWLQVLPHGPRHQVGPHASKHWPCSPADSGAGPAQPRTPAASAPTITTGRPDYSQALPAGACPKALRGAAFSNGEHCCKATRARSNRGDATPPKEADKTPTTDPGEVGDPRTV